MPKIRLVPALVCLLAFAACGDDDDAPSADSEATAEATSTDSSGSATATAADDDSAVLVGAGDIAMCDHENDEATAELLDEIDGIIFTLGDNAYDQGTLSEFEECYDPTWGRHKDRTRPSLGNHEYGTGNADGYFAYFGESCG